MSAITLAPPGRPALATAHLVVSGLLVVAVLVQAALAGQYLFSGGDIAIHGYLGNLSFTLGLVATGLAFAAKVPAWLTLLSGFVLLLLFTQTGLGYVGRDSLDAASWHVPLGVLTFGLATVQCAASAVLPRHS